MGATPPDTAFVSIPVDGSISDGALSSAGNRASVWAANGVPIDSSGSHSLNFGSVSVSEGNNSSEARAVLFRVEDFQGNTLIDNMRFWATSSIHSGPDTPTGSGSPAGGQGTGYPDSHIYMAVVTLDGTGNWQATATAGDENGQGGSYDGTGTLITDLTGPYDGTWGFCPLDESNVGDTIKVADAVAYGGPPTDRNDWLTGSAPTDTTQAIVLYIAVDDDQPLGTYEGDAAGVTNDLQFNMKFDFSG